MPQPGGMGGLGWEWGLRGIFREGGVGKRGSGSRARAELEGRRCGPEEAPPQGPGGRSEEGAWSGGEAGWGLSRGRPWPRATVQGQQWSGRCGPEEGRGPRSRDSHGAARFTDAAPGMTVLTAVGVPGLPHREAPSAIPLEDVWQSQFLTNVRQRVAVSPAVALAHPGAW